MYLSVWTMTYILILFFSWLFLLSIFRPTPVASCLLFVTGVEWLCG
jgi:hypothetical protein